MASQVDVVFCSDSIVRGHHIYKTVWMPLLGETLTATPEPKNGHDRHAWRASATTHCWVYRNSSLACSRANSRALRLTALQVTRKFSALISSILNGSSILWCLVVLLCNLPHPATSLRELLQVCSLFFLLTNSLLINSMHSGRRSVTILWGISNKPSA